MSYPLYGNVIVDSSNSTALGGTLTISNSCKTTSLNNQASIAFAVADISYGTLNRGFFSDNVDFADVRITAIIDTVSPTVGTALSVSVSPNTTNPPIEALRVRSNGNVGIGTQTPQFSLDVNGNARIGTNSTNTFTLFNNPFNYVPWTAILDRSGTWTTNPFINVVDVSGTTTPVIPAPSSIAVTGTTTQLGSITKYYYSVVGKVMYLNWFHFQSGGAIEAGGSGVYYYRIPTGFTLAPWLRETTDPPNTNNAYTGTRLGSGLLNFGARNTSTCSYINTIAGNESIARNYIVIISDDLFGVHSSGHFSYGRTEALQYTFQAKIPLA